MEGFYNEEEGHGGYQQNKGNYCFMLSLSLKEKDMGSYMQITSLMLTKKFQTDWSKNLCWTANNLVMESAKSPRVKERFLITLFF